MTLATSRYGTRAGTIMIFFFFMFIVTLTAHHVSGIFNATYFGSGCLTDFNVGTSRYII
jgi:hypothetical protein